MVCGPPRLRSIPSPPNRETILPRIGSTHQYASARIDEDALKSSHGAATVARLVTARGKRLPNLRPNPAFQRQLSAAMSHACRLAGVLNVHAEVDEIHHHLGVRLRLVVAAH